MFKIKYSNPLKFIQKYINSYKVRTINYLLKTSQTSHKYTRLAKSNDRNELTNNYYIPNREPYKSIEFDLLATSEKLMKTRIIIKPDYGSWLARKHWSAFEAGCLFSGVDAPNFLNLDETIEACDSEKLDYKDDFIVTCRKFLANTHKKVHIILTWMPKPDQPEQECVSKDDPLKLINTHLLTIGNIPQELLVHAEKFFMLLYQSREANEETKKNWRDNWHTIAPQFKVLIDKSTENKKEISPRKEETLHALIGILIDKYCASNKYKKPDGSYKSSTIAEDLIDYISKQFPEHHTPHGFKKSNLIEIINNSLDCWNKKKES